MRTDINDCGMPRAWSEVYWPDPEPPPPRRPWWRQVWSAMKGILK